MFYRQHLFLKRLRRYILNGLTVLSLLLAIATAAMWVRSGFYLEQYVHSYYDREGQRLVANGLQTDGGFFTLTHAEQPWSNRIKGRTGEVMDANAVRVLEKYPYGPSGYSRRSKTTLQGGRRWIPHRVVAHGGIMEGPIRREAYSVAMWVPLLVLLPLPVFRITVYTRRQRRRKAGHCPACGYDMRGNPAKCSECGHEITSQTPC